VIFFPHMQLQSKLTLFMFWSCCLFVCLFLRLCVSFACLVKYSFAEHEILWQFDKLLLLLLIFKLWTEMCVCVCGCVCVGWCMQVCEC
jgi:hypothetical protein